MESSTLIIIAAIVVFLIFRLSRNVTPANKTDAQLTMMYDLAMKYWDPIQGKSKDLLLIEEEMKKRGLCPFNLDEANLSSGNNIDVDTAIKLVEESGMLDKMKDLLDSEISQQIFNKTKEIAQIKNISNEDASNYFNSKFEAASSEYTSMGISQTEADEKALHDALSMEVQ